MYTLLYYPQSSSLAPHILLESIGAPYQLELVEQSSHQRSTSRIDSFERLPLLIDDEHQVSECAAICLYLATKHKEANLLPEDTIKQAECFQWLSFLSGTLQKEFSIYTHPEHHTQSALMYDDIVRTQHLRLREGFSFLNRHLSDKSYLVNDQFSVCDSYLFMLCNIAKDIATPPMQNTHLEHYVHRLREHQAINNAIKAEFDYYKH